MKEACVSYRKCLVLGDVVCGVNLCRERYFVVGHSIFCDGLRVCYLLALERDADWGVGADSALLASE